MGTSSVTHDGLRLLAWRRRAVQEGHMIDWLGLMWSLFAKERVNGMNPMLPAFTLKGCSQLALAYTKLALASFGKVRRDI